MLLWVVIIYPQFMVYYLVMSTSEQRVKLGQRIKDLRREKNITQVDLAAKTGIDRSYLGFIERGERNVSFDVIAEIAKALGVGVNELTRDI